MYLQSSLFTAIVFIALGFANENKLSGNLVKKSLTNIKPNLVNSANAIHELVRRHLQLPDLWPRHKLLPACRKAPTVPESGWKA
jgi:hypothetical protein